MPKLSVNIDHIATLRQSRGTPYPDPVDAAVLAQLGGADGITVHPREDRRHIQDRDVLLLKQILQVPLTLEMALTDEMVELALAVKPFACTLVPELREERTTESGLRVLGRESILQANVKRLLDAGIFVSIFIDTDVDEISAAHSLEVQYVELHTGPYSLAATPDEEDEQFKIVVRSAEHAKELGLRVNAGHGLHYHNTVRIAALPLVDWLHTGHSIISHATLVGMERAVREMQELIRRAARQEF
ncbi:MAG: pyridoxine 5'-phosphate synthase [Candidatus Omnitrophota bacterium]|nr:MAG: pyridoxine 5'-phosphate synthase [Candidatus Omnitrophota bacterium]